MPGDGERVASPSQSDICFLIFPQAELPFRAGDVITVFGNMDDDGFYYVRPLLGKEGVLYSVLLWFTSWVGIRARGPERRLEE